MTTVIVGVLGEIRQAETEKAYLFRISGGMSSWHDREVWTPKSLCTLSSEDSFGRALDEDESDHRQVSVPLWFALKNRMIQ